MASDMYWADKIPSYLTNEGVLTLEKEGELKQDLKDMRETEIVTIPTHIIPHLLKLVRYVLKGTFWLNNLVQDSPLQASSAPSAVIGSRKRKRIVHRLGQGLGRAKKRRFFISNLRKAMQNLSMDIIEQQIRILIAQGVVTAPTHRSVELERNMSDDAINFLKESCSYDDTEIIHLNNANGQLTD